MWGWRAANQGKRFQASTHEHTVRTAPSQPHQGNTKARFTGSGHETRDLAMCTTTDPTGNAISSASPRKIGQENGMGWTNRVCGGNLR